MKILHYWKSQLYKNYKFQEFQISWMPGFDRSLEFGISLQRIYGNLQLIKLFLLDQINFSITHTTKEDHAGLRMELHLFGLNIQYLYIDVRHYDYENDKWFEYGESFIEESNEGN